jgi:hypothetical protein
MLKWKGHLRFNPRFQELGPVEYQRQIAMDRDTGVGMLTYPVMRAVETEFPGASREQCFNLATHIIHEVLHPIEEHPGVWKLYPLRNADDYYGAKTVVDARKAEGSADDD